MVRIGILLGVEMKATLEKDPFKGMDEREAEIEEHEKFVEEKGAVYWDSLRKIRRDRFSFPTFCYLYEAEKRAITYKVEVEMILYQNEILNNEEERRFVPEWREQCLFGRSEFGSHVLSPIWLKFRNFRKINPFSPIELEKWNNTPCRTYRFGYVKELY